MNFVRHTKIGFTEETVHHLEIALVACDKARE